MSKVRVAAFSVSLDGYGAGPDQSLADPLGRGGEDLHQWVFPTRTFRAMRGAPDEGSTGLDDEYARRSFDNVGAWILGRNMFGPVRGPWPDGEWKGWWGDNPPYHVPVFVLTHHERPPLEMAGGTIFHFVTDGFESALDGLVRQPRPKVLDGTQEAKVIALRLGPPPAGFADWSLRLLAERVVELAIAPAISYETVRRTLKKTG